MGGVAPVGQTAAIDPFLTASPSTGLLTGQGEHGLSHPTLEAVVVHELLEQFGIILDERRHDTSERLAVLNASIVLIGVLASVLERRVLGNSKRNGLRDHLLHPVGVLPRDGTEQVIELSQDAREPLKFRLWHVAAAARWHGFDLGILVGQQDLLHRALLDPIAVHVDGVEDALGEVLLFGRRQLRDQEV